MAAPDEITLEDISGVWQLNKSLSSTAEMDQMLEQQGVGWWSRSAISLASVTLHIKDFVSKEDNFEHIDIETFLTGGIAASPENRILSGLPREGIPNKIFNFVGGISQRISEEDFRASNPDKAGFLLQGWLDESFSHKGGIIFSQSWSSFDKEKGETKSPNDWCAWQLWGFQEIDGERRHVRKVWFEQHKGQTHANDAIKAKMVYDYVSPLKE